MRLFVAIELPDNIKDYLYELQNSLKNSQLAKVNWVAKKNLHLTLKFLGDADEDSANKIKEKFKDIKYSKFKAKLSTLGFYPSNIVIKVIRIIVEPEDKFIELQKIIDSETLAKGDLKFGSHITLGRVKFIRNKKDFKEKYGIVKVEPLNFNVNSFTLFNSTLTKDGPIYEVLERYDLG